MKLIAKTAYNNTIRLIAKLSRLPSLREGLGVGCWGAFLLLFLSACSTTSHIPEDDQLFIGLEKIVYTDYEDNRHAEQTQEELEAALATAPNGALFGSSYYRTPFPYGLWIWNATTGSHGVLKKWLNHTFGKAPVLMSQVNPALRAQVARQVLRSNGYMHGDVSYREVPQKNPKKAKIAYTVHMDSLFRVDSMSYVGFPAAMQQLIDSTRTEAAIGADKPFSVANLDAERTRLNQLFRNNGYYYYQPGYASYLADTFNVSRSPFDVNLRLQIADSLPAEVLQPWYIGTTSVRMRRSMMEQADSTVGRRFLKVMFHGKHAPIRPGVILSNMKLRPRQLFSYDNYQESMQKVNATGVFSSVDFQFTPRDRDTLDLLLDCIFDKPYDFYVETNFINRTIGRLGPELKVGLTRRNAFRGGEKLDINLHGSYEWETGGKGSNMNSYQYGADASIEFPRIVFPRFNRKASPSRGEGRRPARRRRFYATPWTIAKVSTDIVQRPSYYKMHIVSGEWTYRWQPSATSRHELSPLTLKYQFMNSHTEKFDSLLVLNPYLSTTMSNYFIPKMRYTYTYASPSGLRNPVRWETTIEESGNVTALYDVLVQGNGWNQKDKTLFKNPYSQFLKIETDLTKTWRLNSWTNLVGHLNYGLMWSYGNSSSGPFSEMFYAGGANSIRAFPVRSIGPGAFPGMGGNNQFSYLMQNGDVKLVMNLELRQRLFGNLYGAVFLDAGNVWSSEDWSLSADDLGPEPDDETQSFVDGWNELFSNNKFRMRNLLRQVATGTGVGLRYDLDFLVLRLDWGFGLHLPYDTGKSGYFNIPRFKDMHTLHLAIGYPF
ncbi:MAG: BamA/TamA family outer membrane protein [Prevotella sp.]|nr:BamA/TamA family outer membrane protein [Prevotella sp.]